MVGADVLHAQRDRIDLMNIVHVAPYGPNCAGIYEAARDMVRADIRQGHNALFVDAGAQPVNHPQRNPPLVGAVDDRAGFRLETQPWAVCNEADVILLHTGCDNQWLVWNQAPIIMVVHGTPTAAFRVEQRGPNTSYSVYTEGAGWPRVKAMLYFWPEFRPYWDVVFPEDKQVVFDFPPVDRERFSADGEAWDIPRFQRGRYNGVICDSWREDSDILEIVHGAMEASRRIQGLTWHIYAVVEPVGPYEFIFQKMRAMGALGTLGQRRGEMEQVYRGADFILSGRRSVSRVIAEALCCGTPVIADQGCRSAHYTPDKHNPFAVAAAIEKLVGRLESDREGLDRQTAAMAERFDLDAYGRRMTALYERVIEEQ